MNIRSWLLGNESEVSSFETLLPFLTEMKIKGDIRILHSYVRMYIICILMRRSMHIAYTIYRLEMLRYLPTYASRCLF